MSPQQIQDDERPPAGVVLAWVADLLFAGRIRGTAQAANVDVAFARSGAQLQEHAEALQPRLILVDLDRRTGEAGEVIAGLKGSPGTRAIPIVAFASHTDAAAIAAARRAGADRVIARSAFVRELPELLRPGPSR